MAADAPGRPPARPPAWPPARPGPAARFAALALAAGGGRPPAAATVLHDEALADDLRVRAWIAALESLGVAPRLIDVRAPAPGGAAAALRGGLGAARALTGAARAWAAGRACWRRVAAAAPPDAPTGLGPFAGLADELRLLWREEARAAALAAGADPPGGLMIANNLAALRCAAALRRRGLGAGLIYDSHEIESRRRLRRRGPARNALRFALERDGTARAARVATVSAALAELFARLHGPALRGAVAVVLNDHFPDMAAPAPAAQAAPTLVFFGSAAPGRGLDEAAAAVAAGVFARIDVFAVGEPARQTRWLEAALGGLPPERRWWRIGPDYQPILAAWRARTPAPWSWVAIAPETLSYRLAAPNKLLQSLRARIPVIALDGGAAGELAASRGVGVAVSDLRPEMLAAAVAGAEHAGCVARIEALLAEIDAGGAPL